MWHDITPDNCSAYQFITGFDAEEHIHLSFPTASLVWPRSAHPKQPWPTRQLCKSKSKKSSTNSVQLRNECPRQKGHRCTKKQHQHKKQIPPTKITLKNKSKSYQSFIPTAYKFLSTSHSNQEKHLVSSFEDVSALGTKSPNWTESNKLWCHIFCWSPSNSEFIDWFY